MEYEDAFSAIGQNKDDCMNVMIFYLLFPVNKESFYHGSLIGLFSNDYNVQSNKASGEGRFDICVPTRTIADTAILIECKRSKSIKDLIDDAKRGAEQIMKKILSRY